MLVLNTDISVSILLRSSEMFLFFHLSGVSTGFNVSFERHREVRIVLL